MKSLLVCVKYKKGAIEKAASWAASFEFYFDFTV